AHGLCPGVVHAAGTRVYLAGDDAGVRMDMRGAWHARVEASDRPQNVDPLELLGVLGLLEEGRVEHRFLVRPGLAPPVRRGGVPRRRRQDLIVGYRAAVQREVMREIAAPRTPETDAPLLAPLGDLEGRARPRIA